jgi:hypothetical protein
MKAVISLMNRNRKLFFRDKGMFFFCTYHTIYFDCIVCNIFSKGL